jgi:hypothetical protein
MINQIILFFSFITVLILPTQGIRFGVYNDSDCNQLLLKSDVYLNVCTWKDEFSFSLVDCHETNIVLNAYNLSTHLRCIGEPARTILITTNCVEFESSYLKIIERMSTSKSLSDTNNCYQSNFI